MMPDAPMTPPDAAAGTARPSRPPPGPLERAHAFLVSPLLAIALLVVVLGCCLAGVTVYRARAAQVIFSTLWFNALLVLLAVSAAAAFFSRIWKRKLTLVSAGMIVFHLSFVALLGGVVYDGLFHFHGVLRLTEGETLPNGDLQSFDLVEAGRFFDPRRLRGETTLVKMHRDYDVGGDNKRAAYEIAVGEGDQKTRGVIYVTEYFDADGVRYFCAKEGYSVLVVLHDKAGQELYGGHVPLQSQMQPGGGWLYTTGSAAEPGSFPFPQAPEHPRTQLLVRYRPNTVVDRAGDVTFEVWPVGAAPASKPARTGTVEVGGRFDGGDLVFEPREIRYWVGMDVRYDPGLGVSLGSLVFGLVGMVLIFVGRLRQGPRKRAAASRGVDEVRGDPARGGDR
jgi:hypothetical protein